MSIVERKFLKEKATQKIIFSRASLHTKSIIENGPVVGYPQVGSKHL